VLLPFHFCLCHDWGSGIFLCRLIFFLSSLLVLSKIAVPNKLNYIILDISHRPLFNLKHNHSETLFCLRLQVAPTQLSPTRQG
jgi:hypothetical protein